jgi:hypothetical protein
MSRPPPAHIRGHQYDDLEMMIPLATFDDEYYDSHDIADEDLPSYAEVSDDRPPKLSTIPAVNDVPPPARSLFPTTNPANVNRNRGVRPRKAAGAPLCTSCCICICVFSLVIVVIVGVIVIVSQAAKSSSNSDSNSNDSHW